MRGDRRGVALPELLVALVILGVGSTGAAALFTLAGLEMERAEMTQQAILLAASSVPSGSVEAPTWGGLLVAEDGLTVRFVPEGEPPRHPPREWDLHGRP